jgi:amino acid transporter
VLQAPVLPFEVVTTIEVVLGKTFGSLALVGILLFFFIAPVVYLHASSRMLFAAAADGVLPEDFSKRVGALSRSRTPVNALLLQSSFAIVYTLCTFLLVPYIVRLGAPADLVNEIYTISAAVVTVLWALGTIFLFIDLLVIVIRHPDLLQEHLVVPLPLLWICMVIGSLACILAIVDTFLYSWIPSLVPNQQWLIWVGATTTSVVVAGIVFVLFFSAVAEGTALWHTLEPSKDDYPKMVAALEKKRT